ncbi:MAG: PIN domain-containing protein [Firmicutes bacterium]|nr:PIN domain-containing protein [Bacillota bacterium]
MSADPQRRFIDTNVLVYAYDPSVRWKHERAMALVGGFWDSGAGCISIQVLQEFYVTVTRKLSIGLPQETAAQIVDDLSTWHVHSPDAQDVLRAIDIECRYKISFWDAMIIRSALRLQCEVILSEDLSSGGVYDGITVINPFTTGFVAEKPAGYSR